MSVYLSSVVSAPAYQSCFPTDPSRHLNFSIHHRFQNVSIKNEIQTETFATHPNSTSTFDSSNIRSSHQIKSTSNPSSPLSSSSSSSSTTTRARAMGNLTEAIERRKSKENIESIPSYNLAKPTSSTVNTKRDEKKALGLRAAVGSYKMRCSGTKSLSASPVTSDQFILPNKATQTSSIKSKPLETVTNMTWIDTPESRLRHSQYLAARRESIIGRVNGGHRRVVSECTTGLNTKSIKALNNTSSPPTPLMTTLPSLDQIRSWVALRKHNVNDSIQEDLTGLSSCPSWGDYSIKSERPLLNSKSKSLPIFSHQLNPSIPRICLSSDSDEEDDGNHDQSDETQSEPPTSSIPMILNTSGLKSLNPCLESNLDFKCTLITSSTTPTTTDTTSSSLNHRAIQRQALLTNLALARRRRTNNNLNSSPQFVAPV